MCVCGGGGGGGKEGLCTRQLVYGREHSCISLVLVVVKTSHFTETTWVEKITAG